MNEPAQQTVPAESSTVDTGGTGASTEAVWEARYRSRDRLFGTGANEALVRETRPLEPGTALELGCGEGGDAIWLAQQGWRVTAADVSPTALRRAAGHAAEADVAERIEWQQHDLAASFPEGAFDLVSACFLYPPRLADRDGVLRSAAGAVSPGGVLLIVSHAGHPPWEEAPDPELRFPAPEEILAALDLPAGGWEVLVAETYERAATGPDGEPTTRTDNTLMLRRRPE